MAHLYTPADSVIVYLELRSPRSPKAQGRLSTTTIRDGRFELLPPCGGVETRTATVALGWLQWVSAILPDWKLTEDTEDIDPYLDTFGK